MKKIYNICIVIFVMILCLCACGTTTTKKDSDDATGVVDANGSENLDDDITEKGIAYEITTNSDYNKLAADFNELIQDAELILKISVEDICAFVGDNGMIQTEITPSVQEVYKGSYSGEKLYVNGGEMLYDEFCKNEIIQKALSGHENPDGSDGLYGKYVRQSVDEQYIFNVGEEYIFFAQKRPDTGKYYFLYAYQGTYKIIDGMIENIALDNEEPLKKDLSEMFNSQTESGSTQAFSLNGNSSTETITSEEIFAKKINDLK